MHREAAHRGFGGISLKTPCEHYNRSQGVFGMLIA